MQNMLQFGRKHGEKLVTPRLSFIYQAIIRNDRPDVILASLFDDSLVSSNYDLTCLSVDVWYLFDRQRIVTHRSFADHIEEPVLRILLATVVQAIADARSMRPCDVHSWIADVAPGTGSYCMSGEVHLCAVDALRYLRDMSPICSVTMGLSEGFLLQLAKRKSDSVESRSLQITRYVRQVSLKPD